MAGVLDMLCLDLPPTATYARRMAVWLPADPSEGDGRLGSLTVVLQRSRKAGAVVESDTYAVVADSPPLNQMGEAYLLLNETDPDQPDVYKVVAGGPQPSCTCKAGLCRLPCKHKDAIRAVIDAGGLGEE